ncbi:MAG: ABC transporter permease [Acidobacteria bacterium]|nr:ABC transporter permease [Acidobacteriota bacterium]
MKILHIAWKSLLEQVRDYRTLLMSFAFPISFILIFGVVMGQNYYTYRIYILNKDIPVKTSSNNSISYGKEFTEKLKNSVYEDGTTIFKVKEIDDIVTIGKKLEKHEYVALIIIPENFSSNLFSKKPGTSVEIFGDPGYPSFSLVKMGIDLELELFVSEKSGAEPLVRSNTHYIGYDSSGSEFNYLAPGLMLMAIYLLLIQVAMVIAQESEKGTIIRLKMAGIGTWKLLSGVACSQVVFAVVMVPMMLYTAILVGFQSKGSLLLGTFFGVIASISAVAIALIVAAFSKTVKEAFLWGNIITIPIIFFSGIFFPMPETTLFHLGSRVFTVWDLMPPTHAHKAFLQIFLYGAGLGDLLYELAMLLIVTALYFCLGVFLFRRAHLKD